VSQLLGATLARLVAVRGSRPGSSVSKKAMRLVDASNRPDSTVGFKVNKSTREDPKAINREDLVKLLEGARTDGRSGGRMEVEVGLAGLAGLRRSEIALVRWSDLNVLAKRLRVLSPKTHLLPYIAASPKLLEILTRNRGDWLDTDTILTSHRSAARPRTGVAR
jgi:integrase